MRAAGHLKKQPNGPKQTGGAAGELCRRVGLDRVADDPPPTTDLLDRHICEGTAWVAATATTVVGYALASIVDGDGHVDQVSVDPAAAGNRSLINISEPTRPY